MAKPIVYIDGREGTTGLQIYECLGRRGDIELLLIEEEKRKDIEARKKCLNAADIVFLCLPDDAAREAVSLIENPKVRVIDASTAHRVSPGWDYGFPELSPELRARIASSSRVANPGCYASGFIALVRPLVVRGVLADTAAVCAHALSGYTGAGKKTIALYEAPERPAELDAPRLYALGLAHKHLPEMAAMTGLQSPPIFLPVICDYPQGMVVSVPLELSQLRGAASVESLRALYGDFYAGQHFIRVMPEGAPESGFLAANGVVNTNYMEIYVFGNARQAVVAARFDNLGKGASGAAVQNMNLMLGLPEETGLEEGEQSK